MAILGSELANINGCHFTAIGVGIGDSYSVWFNTVDGESPKTELGRN